MERQEKHFTNINIFYTHNIYIYFIIYTIKDKKKQQL